MAKTGLVEDRPAKRSVSARKGTNGAATAKNGAATAKNGAAKNGTARNGAARTGAGATAKNGRTRLDDPGLARLEHALQAAAAGDFGVRLPARRKDDIGRLEAAFNQMAQRNAALEAELVRVAEIIGREGRMTERARLHGAGGAWSTAVDSVNGLIDDLVRPTTEVARVIVAVAEGDLNQKMALEIEGRPVKGEFARIGTTVNSMVDQLSSFAAEVTRVAREVGTDGKLGGQAQVPGVAGTWKDLTDSVNFMASNLTDQVRNIAQVTTAVANGDLGQKITVDVKGEILELKSTINTMVDQLRSFADEVTRVAREVGTEGILGGQAQVPGVAGTWKDLTDNVNFMARNLTDQVRNIAQVATAVANGDLTQTITVDARGEILELKQTLNRMVAQLSSFAAEVTRVAREVGTEGKLGGQAEVEGVSGTWRRLTENVNQLAGNLTTQVRAIAEVSTAVTQGDLTRSIAVEAQGEVAELKDNINQMIANLRETTQRNAEQDWLKTNLASISGLLQGQRDLAAVTQLIMSEVTPMVNAQHGAFFLAEPSGDGSPELLLAAAYGYTPRRSELRSRFVIGEGLVGQAAFERKTIAFSDVPPGYIKVGSGLGDASPADILVMPVLFEDQVLGVIELASMRPFSEPHRDFLARITETIGVVLNTIRANMRTEELLSQSQGLTQELQKQSEELRNTNDELQEKASLLSEQNRDIEIKNEEIELARRGLEEKAAQLALSSKYKSEFLANMSHELRTPLNSMLILSRLMAENEESSLSEREVEFARTIHSAGNDLLSLINDILDLSKVEAGRMELDLAPVALADVLDDAERAFRPVAEQTRLAFTVELDPSLPVSIVSDERRLGQVLKNLLSNAFKFTHQGGVTLSIGRASDRPALRDQALRDAPRVIALSVVDTGVGIPDDKLNLIFEAFHQAEGGTARKYGGTGLGLSISREIARLLGGEIQVESTVAQGTRFTLLLPLHEGVADIPSDGSGEHDSGAAAAAGDPVILVIDGKSERPRALLEQMSARGARPIFAGELHAAVELAREHRPKAMLLAGDRQRVETALGQLKKHADIRHVPVVASGDPAGRLPALRAGAMAFLEQPVDGAGIDRALARVEHLTATEARRIAVIGDNPHAHHELMSVLGRGDGIDVAPIEPAGAAGALRGGDYDLAVVLVDRWHVEAMAFLRDARLDPALRELPLIALVRGELPKAERARLDALSKAAVITVVDSPERLADRVALFLHRREATLPDPTRKLLSRLRDGDAGLRGKKVLVVDDDIRSGFALTSMLEQLGMKVVYAENGREGIERLQQHPNTDLVLLDIMMPELDGYETARAIRAMPRFEHLPVVSLTAKAMKDDREKAIAAGATDYITKPVDVDQLVSTMRIWLEA
jgi:signal transduction histidine kinase/HAMP domain-containing protein/DNA-binding response OmpR family regulator